MPDKSTTARLKERIERTQARYEKNKGYFDDYFPKEKVLEEHSTCLTKHWRYMNIMSKEKQTTTTAQLYQNYKSNVETITKIGGHQFLGIVLISSAVNDVETLELDEVGLKDWWNCKGLFWLSEEAYFLDSRLRQWIIDAEQLIPKDLRRPILYGIISLKPPPSPEYAKKLITRKELKKSYSKNCKNSKDLVSNMIAALGHWNRYQEFAPQQSLTMLDQFPASVMPPDGLVQKHHHYFQYLQNCAELSDEKARMRHNLNSIRHISNGHSRKGEFDDGSFAVLALCSVKPQDLTKQWDWNHVGEWWAVNKQSIPRTLKQELEKAGSPRTILQTSRISFTVDLVNQLRPLLADMKGARAMSADMRARAADISAQLDVECRPPVALNGLGRIDPEFFGAGGEEVSRSNPKVSSLGKK